MHQNILDIIAAEENTDDIECRPVHKDFLIAAAKRNKPQFRKYRAVFVLPLKKDGSNHVVVDWDAPDEEIRQLNYEEIAEKRQKLSGGRI